MREPLLVMIAATGLLFYSADTSMAQKKKQPQATTNIYKECCDRSNSRYFEQAGKRHCWVSEQYQQTFYQCVQQRGIRVIDGGQITM